jgi:GT2 family glycosyltransferase
LSVELDDLAVIIVSTNEAHWLRPCLSTLFDHLGDLQADVVVVDNESTDGTRELVELEFPAARVVTSENHGFGHANNRAALTTDARYVVFLNPDTEIREGSFADLVRWLDGVSCVGLAGVKQITADGRLFPTVRRFPNAVRAFWQSLASERFPVRATWLGERELDLDRYERELACDWTSGSFMIARREALESGGLFDERFFLYSEETDLCLRIKRSGWEIRHSPLMTILHHAVKAGANPKLAAQDAFSRRQYSGKNFSPIHGWLYLGALLLGYCLRAVAPGRDPAAARLRRGAARASASALLGLRQPPFGKPPPVAVARRERFTSEG